MSKDLKIKETLDNDLSELLSKFPNFKNLTSLEFHIETDLDLLPIDIVKEKDSEFFHVEICNYPAIRVKDYKEFVVELEKYIDDRIIDIFIYQFK